MRLVLAEPAAEDLGQIIDYIALDNAEAADRIYQAIVRSTQRLLQFPHLGRPGSLPETRELQVPSLPYRIVYRTESNAVVILGVVHDARDLMRAFKERPTK